MFEIFFMLLEIVRFSFRTFEVVSFRIAVCSLQQLYQQLILGVLAVQC